MIRVFYDQINNVPIIKSVKRVNGELQIKTDKIFRPYFYIIDKEAKIIDPIIGMDTKEYVSIFGDKLKKVWCQIPSDVKEAREYFTKTFEADIHFTHRWFIDKFCENQKVVESDSVKILFIDIEVDDREGLPDDENPKQEIISIQFSFGINEKIYVLMVRPNDNFNINDIPQFDNMEFKIFDTEKDMISYFIEFYKISKYSDVITGWNVWFDVGYLIARSVVLNLPITDISPLNIVTKSDVAGTDVVDMRNMYIEIQQKSLKSYSLDSVAIEELGKGKAYHLGGKVYWSWQNDIKTLIEYAYDDVVYLQDLEKKVGIIKYVEEFCNEGWLFDMLEWSNTIADEIFLIEAKRKGIVLPTKPKRKDEGSFTGAVVLDAPVGVFKNVVNFDVQRMYPSIIQQFNLSPECIVDYDGEGVIHLDIVLKTEHKEEIKKTIKIDTTKDSLMGHVFTKLISIRSEYQKRMKTFKPDSEEYKIYYKKQFAMKTVVNAIYGLLSKSSFRLSKPELASATTMLGRKFLLTIKRIMEEDLSYLNLKVLYGDTDSVMTQFSEDVTIEKSLEVAKLVNEKLKEVLEKEYGFKNPQILVEVNTIFDSIFFYKKKKKYTAFKKWEKDYMKNCGECYYCEKYGVCIKRFELKGFEAKKSNTPNFMQELQREVLIQILLGLDEKDVEQFIYDFFKTEVNLENYLLEDIATPVSITRKLSDYKVNAPQVRAARNAEKYLNIKFLPGDKIFYVWVKGYGDDESIDVIGFKSGYWLDIKQIKIDWDRIFQVVNKNFMNIFEELGWKVKLGYSTQSLRKWLE